MKILIAPDKFRGSLSAFEVAQAMADGIASVDATIETILLPLADGGEQTAEILTKATAGTFIEITVQDPLLRPIKAAYGMSANGQTAFIEMAAASGLALLSLEDRNPLFTSTFGTGQLIADALSRGVSEVVLCIGGSATTDAGIGMAQALGYRFFDIEGAELQPIGKNLIRINHIDDAGVAPLLKHTKITVACDVTNPLFGLYGAAYVYGPQKGADPAAVEALDAGLQHFAAIVLNQYGHDLQQLSGAGAAGGLGAGCVTFLGATLRSGIETVMQVLDFEVLLSVSDVVLTGEGKIDEQTLSGKVVRGVAQKANEAGIMAVGLCGTLALSAAQLRALGLAYAVSVLPRPMTLAEANAEAYQLVQDSTAILTHLLQKKPTFAV
jgi:glycerate 2-kinase